MTTENLTALAASADRLAEVRPEGRLQLDADLVAVLADRVAAAGEEDREVAAAVAEGDAFAAAIDAGCPPQFHPGVPAQEAAVLLALRTRLGLDRATEIELTAGTEDRHARVLRSIGCTLAGADG